MKLSVEVLTQTLLQTVCPLGHRHTPAWQVRPPVQALLQPPQWAELVLRLASQPSPAMLLQLAKPELQVNPHTPERHVAVALVGTVQTLHVAPHARTSVLLTHDPLQRWNPALQVNPQTIPLHVAVALGGGAHAVQDVVPQFATFVLLTHDPLQG